MIAFWPHVFRQNDFIRVYCGLGGGLWWPFVWVSRRNLHLLPLFLFFCFFFASTFKIQLNFNILFALILLFRYDLGVTGGVESMASFQQKFFPEVYARTESGGGDDSRYCIYNDHILQLFTSVLFLAGLLVSLPASYVTRRYGRKVTMICAGAFFLVGAGLNAGAQDLGMLIVGRIFLGAFE